MSKNNGFKKFALGALVGVGLGVLFAPKKGSETRKELKDKLNDLVIKVRNLNKEDIKVAVENKVKDIQSAVNELDSETVLASAKKKAKKLQSMVGELGSYVASKSTPAIDKTIDAIQVSTDKVVDSVLKKLEKK